MDRSGGQREAANRTTARGLARGKQRENSAAGRSQQQNSPDALNRISAYTESALLESLLFFPWWLVALSPLPNLFRLSTAVFRAPTAAEV